MTNKTERYFVVSENELKELLNATVESILVVYDIIEGSLSTLERHEKAEAACRARPARYYGDAHDFDGKLLGSLWATRKVEVDI